MLDGVCITICPHPWMSCLQRGFIDSGVSLLMCQQLQLAFSAELNPGGILGFRNSRRIAKLSPEPTSRSTMSSIQTIALLITSSGLLIFGLSIPLIRHRVPPNAIYGIRTRAAFASESDWYRINEIGGRYLAVSGVLITAIGAAGFFLPESVFNTYSTAAAIATMLAVLIPCIRLCRMKAQR